MAISYPIQPEEVNQSKWSFLDLNASSLPSQPVYTWYRRTWPRSDGQEIVGLESHILPLQHIDNTRPPTDDRVNNQIAAEVINTGEQTVTRSWTTQRRSNDEIIQVIRNIEQAKNVEVFDGLSPEVETRVSLAIELFRENAQTLPSDAEARQAAYRTQFKMVLDNRIRAEQLISGVNNGDVINLDEGWKPEEE